MVSYLFWLVVGVALTRKFGERILAMCNFVQNDSEAIDIGFWSSGIAAIPH